MATDDITSDDLPERIEAAMGEGDATSLCDASLKRQGLMVFIYWRLPAARWRGPQSMLRR